MAYSKRIRELCSLLTATNTFADVGCDHGYCTEYMLKNGLCKRAIFSDISKGSLQKAERLLGEYVQNGVATPVLGGGFYGVSPSVDLVLIAGMGGSEIVGILSDKKYGFIPKKFVFQPMHDSEKLRRYLLENGAYIERDYTFEDGKFYDVIVGTNVAPSGEAQGYTDLEYEFGKENLTARPQAFVKRLKKLLAGIERYLSSDGLQPSGREELQKRKEKLEGVLKGDA